MHIVLFALAALGILLIGAVFILREVAHAVDDLSP